MRSAAWDAWVNRARSADILAVARARLDLKLTSGRGGKELTGPCPDCGGDDRFVVTSIAKKKVFRCRGCGKSGDVIALVEFLDKCDFDRAVEKLTGEPKPQPQRKANGKASGKLGKIVAIYDYTDEAGTLLFQVTRHDPKDFRQRRPNGKGGWIDNTDGVRRVPYRLPQIIAAIAAGQITLVVEGERDVATADALGYVASCAPGGVGMGWRDEYDAHFTGADVVIIPDNDADPNKGPRYAKDIAGHLVKVARNVRMLTLPESVKDLSEWVEAGGTREALATMIINAPDYVPDANPADLPPEPPPPPDPASADEIEITRLAKLQPLEYERERKAAADRLDVRASILDRLVRDERARMGLDGGDDDKQGHAIEFPDPEPWPEPVDGAALLNAMAAAIRKHVVMSDTSSHVAALWVLHSWLINIFVISPRLCVRSATKGCGKTLLLDVLGRLVRCPLRTLSITPAATFRVIEGWQPTLLIDEADTFLNDDNEGLRGILDGNRKGDTVLRTVGDDFEARAFATYAAVTIALIGTLPDTLHDRSVVIELKRRLPKEKIAPFRFDRAGDLDVLARMAARWAADVGERVAATDPQMPKGVINREADNWRPLGAIAAVAKGRWPARLATAATAAHAGTVEGDAASALEILLADIRDAFATDKATKVTDMFGAEQIEIASAALVKVLVGLDGRPWAEMGRERKPMTPTRLASMLRPLKIKPTDIGPEDDRKRGYRLNEFAEAFDRYLEGGSQPCSPAGADKTGVSDDSKVRSQKTGCGPAKSQKPNENGDLWTCEVAEGGAGGETPIGTRFGAQKRTLYGVTFTVLGQAQPGTPCLYCDGTEPDDEGPVMVVNGAGPLHEACAPAWINNQDGSR